MAHQSQAFGNSNGRAPFQQAILQSPAFTPGDFGADKQESIFNEFLAYCNVSTIEEARNLPSEILILANAKQVGKSPISSFTYRPVVDGVFVPEAPSTLMKQGRLDTSVNVMSAYNENDGIIFSDFSLTNDTEYRNYVSGLLNLQPNQINYVASAMYPPVFDGSHGYVDEISRAGVTFQEAVIQCHEILLGEAMSNRSFNYLYDVFPGLHAMDLEATFNSNLHPQPGVFDSSIAVQELIASFTLTGKPTSSANGRLPTYGRDHQMLVINSTAVHTESESQSTVARCEEWYELMYGQ